MRRCFALLLIAMAISGCGEELILREVRIVKNGNLTPGLPIRFDPSDLPRLQELKQRENLGDYVEETFALYAVNARSEFESILRIKNWVAAQWPHSLPDPYPPWDAIEILDWIRAGKTGGFCGQYSQVLLQALNSFGIQARYVEIGSTQNPFEHFVVEVWSNDFDKWVVMDADFNVHFERYGIPLGALELQDALLAGETDEVVEVLGEFRAGHDYPNRFPLRTIELYYYIRVMLKADHLSVPEEKAFDRYNDMVEWQGGLSIPWEQSTVSSDFVHKSLTNQTTQDRFQFNAKLNQVEVTVESVAADGVHLRFATNHRNFHGYALSEVSVATGQLRNFWGLSSASTHLWKPIPGLRLEVRAVGADLRPGPPATLEGWFDRQ